MLESTRRPIRVIKVGGSLFDLPDLRQRVAEWRSRQPTALDVLIAGVARRPMSCVNGNRSSPYQTKPRIGCASMR
ncbi:MAG: hypothetical protein R3C99_27825 [Pirellulaceae bacterium]